MTVSNNITMKNLIQDTIEKIKKQHIAPEPKWKFSVRKYSIWLLFFLTLLLGAASLSVAYHLVSGLDWDLYSFMHKSRINYALSIFPYFWLILIILFFSIAFLDIRKTESGYRYSWTKIILLSAGGIFTIAILITIFNFGGRVHPMVQKNFPYYARHMLITKEAQWMQPEKGLLAGEIISRSEREINIEDLTSKNWTILINEKTLLRPSANLSPGETIKIIGARQGENSFEAQEIRPWFGQRGMMMGCQNSNGCPKMMPGRSK